MTNRIPALLIASAAFVGWFENPAHSEGYDPLNVAAVQFIASDACKVAVPETDFLRMLTETANDYGVNVGTARILVIAEAQRLYDAIDSRGQTAEFCNAALAAYGGMSH